MFAFLFDRRECTNSQSPTPRLLDGNDATQHGDAQRTYGARHIGIYIWLFATRHWSGPRLLHGGLMQPILSFELATGQTRLQPED